jgi:hypothetical protein
VRETDFSLQIYEERKLKANEVALRIECQCRGTAGDVKSTVPDLGTGVLLT